jgi:hypothetical protein
MDELNNRQIILLTMLVSFVVSTATGIMTVAMLEEAPQAITQTVNRVVERTIERVVTGTTTDEKPAPAPITTTVTKEITVFAKEDDLIVGAVEKNQPRIARIYGPKSATSSLPDAIGAVISRDGVIAADLATVSTFADAGTEVAVLIAGKSYTGVVKDFKKGDTGIALIRLYLDPTDAQNAVSFGSNVTPKIAQSLILLGGVDGESVTKSTVSKLNPMRTGSTTNSGPASILVNPRVPDTYQGALVVNLDGHAVGIVTTDADQKLSIFPAWRIFELIAPPEQPPSAKADGESTQSTASVAASMAR